MNSNIKCTLEEYEKYTKPINEKINKISLLLLIILFITIIIFGRSSYIGNTVLLTSLLIVSLNVDIKTTQKNIKKSLESNYILIDDEMVIYYTNIFKLGKKLNKTYYIKKINEIEYKNSYYIIYGEIDLTKENIDGTEENKKE